MKLLKDLENSFQQFRSHLIRYFGSKGDNSDKLAKATQNIQSKISTIQFSKGEEVQVTETDIPIAIASLLRNVRDKYSSIEGVRNEIDQLDKSKLIDNLQKKRNMAAHANTLGLRQEFNKEEIEEMIKDIREILFRLSNIHDNVMNSSI